jgi:hypothetical protein
MTPAQCRAARDLLEMTLVELAGAAEVPVAVIVDYETSLNFVPKVEHIDAMQAALERAGVLFVEENGHGPGVRLRLKRGGGDAD